MSNMDMRESFVFIGTQQPLDLSEVSAKERNKFLPVHLQEARDERGRKRLHGAFTGGFSAGYFNTVGSREGWTPSQFTSSRSARSSKGASRPEDFMDEEDLKEFKASTVGMTKEYDPLSLTQNDVKNQKAISQVVAQEKSALIDLTTKVIEDLVVPSLDPIGSRLLRQMGWRPGQGVGPRTKRKYSQFLNTEEEDIHAQNHLFAPKDIKMLIIKGKKDRLGLGYNPMNLNVSKEKLTSKRLQGFGVGVFEDEEDEDIYGEDRNFELNIVEEVSMDVHQKAPVPRSLARYCRDGRPPLANFILSVETLLDSEKWFEPPILPKDYKPIHQFKDSLDITSRNAKLLPDQRRDILGEEALKGPARSIYSYIPIKAQQRLESYLEKVKEKIQPTIPKIEKSIALAALRGFMPFANDAAKQHRYKTFLNVMAEEQEADSITNFNPNELKEFCKAAQMYRPLSDMMASRFTSASMSSSNEFAVDSKVKPEPAEPTKKPALPLPKVLTRTKFEWRPDRILCKRFNVPNPYPDTAANLDAEKKKEMMEKEILNEKTMDELKRQRDRMLNDQIFHLTETQEQIREIPLKESMQMDDDKEEEEMIEKPSMDIFKAIFVDSDDEAEDIEDDTKNALHQDQLKQENVQKIQKEEKKQLFRPIFRKKQDRNKELNDDELGVRIKDKIAPDVIQIQPKAEPLVAVAEMQVDPSVPIAKMQVETQVEPLVTETEIVTVAEAKRVTVAPILAIPPPNHFRDEEPRQTSVKKSKKEKRKKKKKRKTSSSSEDEWVEAPAPMKPKASDFM